jgi:hypothetical protein
MKNYGLETTERMKMVPGIKPGIFTLQFTEDYNFHRKDILVRDNGFAVKVIKVYKYNLWKRILNFFGIPFKLFNCVLVKEIKK